MNIHHPASATSRQRPGQTVLSRACLLLLATPASVLAVTETWDGGGADNKLSTANNWLDNSVPANDSSATNLVFSGSTRLSPLVDGNGYFHALTFAPGAGAFQIVHPAGTYYNFYVDTGGVTNQSAVTQHLQKLTVSDDYAAPTPIVGGAGGLTIGLLTGLYNQEASVVFPTEAVMSGNITVSEWWSPGGLMTYNGGGTLTLGPAADCPVSLTLNSGTARTKGPFYLKIGGGLGSNTKITLNGGSLLPEDDFFLYEFMVDFTRSANAVFTMPAGKTFYIWDSATASFTGSYSPTTACNTSLSHYGRLSATTSISINNGAALYVNDKSRVIAGSYLDVGNGSAGTLVAGGPDTEVKAAGVSDWGNGTAGTVTFSDGAKGTFDTLRIAGSVAGAASNGVTLVKSGATLMTGPLQIGTTPIPGAKGSLTVTGAGSAVTLADGAAFSLGSASGGSGTLTVESGAVFNTGLAPSAVSATGKIKLSGSGALNLIGDMTLTGGTLESGLAAAGGVAMSAGHTLRMQGGGDALFAGPFTLDKASGIQVSGAGSSFVSTGGALAFKGGSTVTVDAGGAVSANQYVDIGNGGGATVTVTGTGSSLSAGGSICDWGNNAGSANITFSNEAQASTAVLRLATAQAGNNATVLVQDGADLNTSSITAGTSSLAGSASLTVTGTGATLTQAGAATFTLGAPVNTTATFNTGTGAVVQTGTGAVTIAATGAVNMNGGFFTARGPLTHSGQLSVTDGTFTANVSAALNGVITTGPAGILTLKGAVTGTSQFSGPGHVDFAGSYSPGAGPGSITAITFQTDAAFKPTNTLTMELAGPASMDKLIFQGPGSAAFARAGSLNVIPAGGFQPQAGQSFDLFDFDPAKATGTFVNLSLPTMPPGLFWRTDRLNTEGILFVSTTPQNWDQFLAAYDLDTFDNDQDGDGYSSGLEMLLGTNPAQRSSIPSGLTRRSVTETPAGTAVSFMFEMPEWPAEDGTYRILAGSDLVNWQVIATKAGSAAWSTTAGTGLSSQSIAPERLRMTVTETLPAGTTHRFHRLEAVQQ